mgnify:FL=1
MTEPGQRKKRWWIILVIAIALVGVAVHQWREILSMTTYHRPIAVGRQFHDAVAGADRIVIREGGFDCCGSVDEDPVRATVTDKVEIQQVFSNIAF